MHKIYIIIYLFRKKRLLNSAEKCFIPNHTVPASNRIKGVCLWQPGIIVHTSQTVCHACDIRVAVPEVKKLVSCW